VTTFPTNTPVHSSLTDLLTLVSRDVSLTRQANTHGGEYAGPCPFCGGVDRFRVWPYAEQPGWWCRRCRQSGDTVGYIALRQKVSRAVASAQLGLATDDQMSRVAPVTPPEPVKPPPPAWRAAANTFVNACYERLWSTAGAIALRFLHARYGLDERMLVWGMLGYNDRDQYMPREAWGLPPKQVIEPGGRRRLVHNLWLPRGIVIPWFIVADTWKIFIRRPVGQPKYYQLPGGSNTLYGADALSPTKPALLCEAALDALVIRQVAGDLITPVASGTTGARRMNWIIKLAQTPQVLLAFDQDAGGDSPEDYWSQVLPRTRIWRPYVDDPAAMHVAGMDVRAWIAAGLTISRNSTTAWNETNSKE
jgi:hypothetical protein